MGLSLAQNTEEDSATNFPRSSMSIAGGSLRICLMGYAQPKLHNINLQEPRNLPKKLRLRAVVSRNSRPTFFGAELSKSMFFEGYGACMGCFESLNIKKILYKVLLI